VITSSDLVSAGHCCALTGRAKRPVLADAGVVAAFLREPAEGEVRLHRVASLPAGNIVEPEEDVDIDSFKGMLFKRKDFLGIEEEGASRSFCSFCDACAAHAPAAAVARLTAKLHPSRTYYYRKNLDIDKLIEQCTAKVRAVASRSYR
jgi:hypothetical protein